MSKKEYLLELEKQLKSRNIPNIMDIIEEYDDHFCHKIANGFSEEEIAHKLGKPALIADEYLESISDLSKQEHQNRFLKGLSLAFIDFFAAIGFIILYAWVIVLAAFSIACFALGVCALTTLNIANLIPTMPYWASILLAICSIALSVLSAIGTIYCCMFATNLAKSYISWTRYVMDNIRCLNDSLHPSISPKLRRKLGTTAIISLIIFGVFFVVYLFAMFAYCDFQPFWHVLNWFQ